MRPGGGGTLDRKGGERSMAKKKAKGKKKK